VFPSGILERLSLRRVLRGERRSSRSSRPPSSGGTGGSCGRSTATAGGGSGAGSAGARARPTASAGQSLGSAPPSATACFPNPREIGQAGQCSPIRGGRRLWLEVLSEADPAENRTGDDGSHGQSSHNTPHRGQDSTPKRGREGFLPAPDRTSVGEPDGDFMN